MTAYVPKIGIDVGGVIAVKTYGGEDTNADSLDKPPMTGSVETIRELVKSFGPINVFIVSYCGKAREIDTMKWFTRIGFFYKSGLLKENVHFTRSRQAKAGVCNRLGIDYFIDDTWEVVENLLHESPQMRRVLWFSQQRQWDNELPEKVKRVRNWEEIQSFFQ